MDKEKVSKRKIQGFTPIRLQAVPTQEHGSLTKVVISGTIKGNAADEFEKLREEYGLNRSQLMAQMVYHCLNRSDELKDLYKRLAILGN